MAKPNWWQQRWISWFNRRHPRQSSVQLNHRNLYILPTRAGVLFILLALGLFVLGTNYQNNLMLLLSFFIPALLLTHLLGSYQQLHGTRLSVETSGPHFAHQPCHITLRAQRKSATAGRWRIHHKSRLLADVPTDNQPIRLNIGLFPRGEQELPVLILSSRYPLGLFRCWCYLRFSEKLLVYPAPQPGPTLDDWRDASTHQQGQNQVGNEEFDRLQEYLQGESLGKIAWKQLAQGRGLLTKQFNHEGQRTLWLTLPPQHGEQLEQQLSYLSGRILSLTAEHRRFGLRLPHQTIEPDNSTEHQWQCLGLLARYPML